MLHYFYPLHLSGLCYSVHQSMLMADVESNGFPTPVQWHFLSSGFTFSMKGDANIFHVHDSSVAMDNPS